ncbi:hypothetical protein [Chitinophaga oryziterrae]|nr:hypothetical protein [Chitinophaga oryziterrae]
MDVIRDEEVKILAAAYFSEDDIRSFVKQFNILPATTFGRLKR